MQKHQLNTIESELIEGWINTLLTSYCQSPSKEVARSLCHYLDLLINHAEEHFTKSKLKSFCLMKRFWQWRIG